MNREMKNNLIWIQEAENIDCGIPLRSQENQSGKDEIEDRDIVG